MPGAVNDAIQNPNETMQRTASQSAFHFSSLCHPPFGCVESCTGLAVADLVPR